LPNNPFGAVAWRNLHCSRWRNSAKASIQSAAFKRWSNLTNRTWEQAALLSFMLAVRTTYYFFGCVVAPGVTPEAAPFQNSTQPRSPECMAFPGRFAGRTPSNFALLMMLVRSGVSILAGDRIKSLLNVILHDELPDRNAEKPVLPDTGSYGARPAKE
jgi:hypothetical protein